MKSKKLIFAGLAFMILGTAWSQVYERKPREYDFELSDIAKRITPVLSFNANMHPDNWIWKEGRSSTLVENGKPADFYEINKINDVDDDNCSIISTAWVEGKKDDGIGEWVIIPVKEYDEDTLYRFNRHSQDGHLKVSLSVLNGFQQNEDLYRKNNRVKEAKVSVYIAAYSAGQDDAYLLWNPDCIHEEVITLSDEIIENPIYLNLSENDFFMPIPEKYNSEHIQVFLKFEILSVYKGTKYSDTCISNMDATVEWLGER